MYDPVTRDITLKGRIQGIGFRPFIYRIAVEAGCRGWVQNTGNGVRILVQGNERQIENFTSFLHEKKPPLAVYDDIMTTTVVGSLLHDDFKIIKSSGFTGAAASYIPPDLAICPKCLEDMNTGDRPGRKTYPFTSCVDCGPRYSVIRQLPYDRPYTEMDRFPLCDTCMHEYTNPVDRRYHAQTTCCRECGPRYTLYDSDGRELQGSGLPLETMKLVKEGNIIAIKGIGGSHLACNPYDDTVVHKLRTRKGDRESKPFALMSRDVQVIREHAYLEEPDIGLLSSPRRPIVLLPRKKSSCLSPSIAPKLYNIGFMLPYTGMHHLLFQHQGNYPDQLVMTSGNPSHEPILADNEKILDNLSGIADYYLLHDRNIYQKIDDSVIKSTGTENRLFIRRSRGWVPEPVQMPPGVRDCRILGLGAEMHNTPAIALEGAVFPGQYNGDIKYEGNFQFYLDTVKHLLGLYGLQKKDLDIIACDMHPDYASSRYGLELSEELNTRLCKIQHHHSHACSVMTENSVKTDEEVIAVLLDGTGYGNDGHIWGGEIFRCGYASFERIAHLEEVLIPGGDAAIKYPGRMLMSYLGKIYRQNGRIQELLPEWLGERIISGLPGGSEEATVILQQLKAKLNCIPTTSAGRFLDSLSFLLGFNTRRSYEGEPAIILESSGITGRNDKPNPLELDIAIKTDKSAVFKTVEMLEDVISLVNSGHNRFSIAYWVQAAMAESLSSLALDFAEQDNLPVVISGGVTYNSILQQIFDGKFKGKKTELLVNKDLPPGDGCISTGQVVSALSKSA